ncbi:HPr family phosphocarrier protein [Vallitalea okinawensis]|uniref:HPr family phosphocarrier protein n=1 Tax=Vallitalea okinawensis TaxID=2078660 RepID=UPI000CFCE7C0|nr:HPr family phosphocarrier protein [Vallitalea okinawensis]
MTSSSVKLINEAGLHARPANLFIRLAKEFKSQITVEKDGVKVDAKGILGILTLGAACGCTITLEADGQDEKEAIEALQELVESGFNE